MIEAIRTGRVYPTNESPVGALWKSDWNNWAPRVGFAYDVRGDGRMSIRGGYGIGYERNFGNVTYNVLFNPPEFLIASIDAPTDVPSLPIYTDPAGPFGGVAGVTKTIPVGSLRHVDQNIETAYAHFYGLSFQTELLGRPVARVEYSGRLGASCTTWRTRTSPARPWCTPAPAARSTRHHAVLRVQHARQPRPVGVQRHDVRPRVAPPGRTPGCSSGLVHLRACQGQPEQHVQRLETTTSTWASSTRSTRCSTGASPTSTCGTAGRSRVSGLLPFYQ
jgi:hypothetical protein